MDLFEEKIKKAIEDGALDDLPGKGKPLDITDSAIHNEYWLVNKILKNANYLPPWLELDKKIRESKEKAHEMIAQHQSWLQEQLELMPTLECHDRVEGLRRIRVRHEEAHKSYVDLIKEINPMIRKMNLEAPLPHFQKTVICEEEWLKHFDACEELYEQVLQLPMKEEGANRSVFRKFLAGVRGLRKGKSFGV